MRYKHWITSSLVAIANFQSLLAIKAGQTELKKLSEFESSCVCDCCPDEQNLASQTLNDPFNTKSARRRPRSLDLGRSQHTGALCPKDIVILVDSTNCALSRLWKSGKIERRLNSLLLNVQDQYGLGTLGEDAARISVQSFSWCGADSPYTPVWGEVLADRKHCPNSLNEITNFNDFNSGNDVNDVIPGTLSEISNFKQEISKLERGLRLRLDWAIEDAMKLFDRNNRNKHIIILHDGRTQKKSDMLKSGNLQRVVDEAKAAGISVWPYSPVECTRGRRNRGKACPDFDVMDVVQTGNPLNQAFYVSNLKDLVVAMDQTCPPGQNVFTDDDEDVMCPSDMSCKCTCPMPQLPSIPGETGNPGERGPPGESGPPGLDGFCDPNACTTQEGPRGFTGETGATGSPGKTGKPGKPGKDGKCSDSQCAIDWDAIRKMIREEVEKEVRESCSTPCPDPPTPDPPVVVETTTTPEPVTVAETTTPAVVTPPPEKPGLPCNYDIMTVIDVSKCSSSMPRMKKMFQELATSLRNSADSSEVRIGASFMAGDFILSKSEINFSDLETVEDIDRLVEERFDCVNLYKNEPNFSREIQVALSEGEVALEPVTRHVLEVFKQQPREFNQRECPQVALYMHQGRVIDPVEIEAYLEANKNIKTLTIGWEDNISADFLEKITDKQTEPIDTVSPGNVTPEVVRMLEDFCPDKTCNIWGDPHYSTFDMETTGQRFDFMGHCAYTAVTTEGCPKPSRSIREVPHYLQIDVSNSVHNKNLPEVTYVKNVYIEMYDDFTGGLVKLAMKAHREKGGLRLYINERFYAFRVTGYW